MNTEDNISVSDKIIATTNSIYQRPSDELREQLIFFINELINKDFNALVQLLYRIDVDEKKLKNLLNQYKETDASALITDLIIERQLQKIATKKQFNSKGGNAENKEW
jgi:hypothetical protein